jgi:hypothetical protein
MKCKTTSTENEMEDELSKNGRQPKKIMENNPKKKEKIKRTSTKMRGKK